MDLPFVERHSPPERPKRHVRLLIQAIVGLLLFVNVPRADAQQQSDAPARTTGLALQNFNQVAASVGDIKAILVKDVGLMVELKRWVAKDATDHGQIVGETELSDYAIFDRLATDIEFRSVATALVQKYGYLVPKLNPESDLAKEQELLRVERTKWLAQAQEEERAQSRQKAQQAMQKAVACQAQPSDRDCSETPSAPPADNTNRGRQLETLPAGNPPPDMNIPSGPTGPGNLLQRTQLMQTGASGMDMSMSPQLDGSYGGYPYSSAGSPFSSTGDMGVGSLSADSTGSRPNRQIAAAFGGSNGGGTAGSSDGLLGAFGMGPGTGSGMGSDFGGGLFNSGGSFNSLSQSGTGSSLLVPMQPNRRYPEQNRLNPPG